MQQIGTEGEKLPQIIKITKLPIDETNEYLISSQNPWLNELLSELILVGKEMDPNGLDKWEPKIEAKLSITRKHNHTYKDHLIIKGHLIGHYQTHCVRCLRPILSEFNHSFETCFIPGIFENTPEYEDATHIYAAESELELYFHSKGIVDLKELVHEHLFLTVDEFPLHDEECKGLCQVCGTDLNEECCKHV